ncbi:hypothetical protein [Methylocystis sp. JR02]|uniref:hypothetical protein n=1 Tax=Methylocystis sp. JR02 TaxID=3046284 RepID=UPI0024B9A923|nr:hypothetical protein [Methylocystis sp. JR02]MDJ0447128.1 hypothetical protein [Methylocystis sp. JR02]
MNPRELRLDHLRGMGHPFETKVVDGLSGTKVGEGMRKAGTAGNFMQKLGNANARHQPIQCSVQTLGFQRCDRLRRRHAKNAVSKHDARHAIKTQGIGETA